MKQQEVSKKGTDGKYIENKSSSQVDGQLIKPNYLTTYDFLMKMKKQKIDEIQKKQQKKGYLAGFAD